MSKYLVELIGSRQSGTMSKSYTVDAESESNAEKSAMAKLRSDIFFTQYSWSVKRIQKR
ncbi:hypothetical protein I0D00_15515 [Pseudomonas lalucatii]|uniref:Uncharacterized protein n=1 Tax=Pseudomonas lalucatii TaxID=1424203 RepID=A0ABS5Q3P0_9PSED|nr:hypothetical protein [Pseudomonas lalucatii]MBS7663337.1 hypothetical protein [Pseudomonas lalucatii]